MSKYIDSISMTNFRNSVSVLIIPPVPKPFKQEISDTVFYSRLNRQIGTFVIFFYRPLNDFTTYAFSNRFVPLIEFYAEKLAAL